MAGTAPDAPAPLRAEPPWVLQVSAFFDGHGGGIEVVAGQLARRLARGGRVRVHWMAGGAADEQPVLGQPGLQLEWVASVDPLERRIGLPAPLWGWAGLRALWRAVGRAQLVHVHDVLYAPSLLALLFAALRGRPTLLTQHIGEIPFRGRLPRAVLAGLNRSLVAAVMRRVGQVVFVGRPVQRYFEGFVRFRRPPLLNPNGVDAQRYHPLPRPPADAAVPVALLFVGRFVEKKGLLLLRHCLDLPGARWTFVGSGPLPPVAEGLTQAPVQRPGKLPPEAVVAHYQAADLLVLPSTGEGFPLVVQEALACGTPVLVSAEVAEAFPALDPRCVFQVELRGVADPAAALRLRLADLCADPAALRAARPLAVALAGQWRWERCVQVYEAAYAACGLALAEPA